MVKVSHSRVCVEPQFVSHTVCVEIQCPKGRLMVISHHIPCERGGMLIKKCNGSAFLLWLRRATKSPLTEQLIIFFIISDCRA